jgi:bifunctional UDP-N-acetylglucosamine pyrophosphorylase/glucosamine-1-phosphate N-acetyltransferase
MSEIRNTKYEIRNFTAVILAAGLGTRMKTEKPKVLHEVAWRPMLGRVIDSLEAAGIEDIIAVVGYKAEEIKPLFAGKTRFVVQEELLGSGHALSQAVGSLEDTGGNVLVTCGDTPLICPETYKALGEKHIADDAACTILTAETEDPFSYGRICRGANGEVKGIIEEKDATGEEKKIREVNAGSYCFRTDTLKDFIDKIELNEKKKEFYLTDIVEILERNGKKLSTSRCSFEEALGINSRKDLAVANKTVFARKIEELMDSGVTVVDPGSTYIDESAQIGKDTVIFPCTVIEKDVKVGASCKIGPFARLRPGTKIADSVEIGNYVELCRTQIGEGSKVKHHSYLGDTQVGRNANIGAGTITANYDGEKKHATIIGDEAFIGIGVSLIAPVTIGKGAKVGAGSVVTKNKNVKDGETVAGVPAKPLK